VLVPSLYTDWLCTGDVLRTGAYCLFLAGAAYELQQYWRAQPHVAVLRERRLLAGQLHDGVIQELIYIRSLSHTLSNASRVDTHIIDACDRALDDVRAAVDVLSRVVNDPLALLLRRAARELESRYLIDVKLDMDDSIDATSAQKHALTRIAREAVSNAVRHGKATQIGVSLVREGDLQLMTILDDGLGFDVAGATGSNAGYGLISMREWAGTLPGSFEVHAEPGGGTLVSVRW
jgi:signal transduction histidine kinase